MLSIKKYRVAEEAGKRELPNRVVEMVNPIVFASEGYPTRIHSEEELWKYLDVMHETRFENDFNYLFNGRLTPWEFSQIKEIAEDVCAFSQKHYGRTLTTTGSLLRALQVFRHIHYIFGDNRAKVFEIGPGSGYLGYLFIKNGWSYCATDITEAFYLMQNHLWNELTNGGVVELCEREIWDGKIAPHRPVHIPWWKFYQLFEMDIPAVDVVTCNHALAEMHPNSLSFVLNIARKMLRINSSDEIKLFMFEGWGYEKFVSRSEITEQFYKIGFRLIHNDLGITVFCPKECVFASPFVDLPRFPPVKKFIKSSISNWFKLPSSVRFSPPKIAKKDNRISKMLLEGNILRESEKKVDYSAVKSFYSQLVGQEDISSPDEKFLTFIGKEY